MADAVNNADMLTAARGGSIRTPGDFLPLALMPNFGSEP